MARKKLIDTVEDSAQLAAKRASETFVDAAERLAPLIDQAADYLGPLAEEAGRVTSKVASDAYSKVKPALHDAQVRGARLAAGAYDRVQPALDTALQAVPPAVDSAVGKVRPALDDVLERIPSLVEDARSAVQDDVLPKLAGALKELAKQPLAAEAAAQMALATAVVSKELRKAGKATAQVSKELRKAEKAGKRTWPKTFGKLLLAGAAVAAVVVAVRKLLAPPNDGWHAHTPADAYVADPTEAVQKVADAVADKVEDAKKKASDLVDDAKDAVEDAKEKASDLAEDAKEAVEDAAEKAADKAEDVVDEVKDAVEGDDAAPFADSPFGEGSFQGSEPPEGHPVKANSRTRKYRVPGGPGYDKAAGDVWFTSAEVAEAAGFSEAQR